MYGQGHLHKEWDIMQTLGRFAAVAGVGLAAGTVAAAAAGSASDNFAGATGSPSDNKEGLAFLSLAAAGAAVLGGAAAGGLLMRGVGAKQGLALTGVLAGATIASGWGVGSLYEDAYQQRKTDSNKQSFNNFSDGYSTGRADQKEGLPFAKEFRPIPD